MASITNGIIAQDSNRTVDVYTNGTICPKDEILKTLKGKRVHFYITDYGDKLSKNIDRLIESLEKFDLGYYRKPAGNWVDCSRIENITGPYRGLNKSSKNAVQKNYLHC